MGYYTDWKVKVQPEHKLTGVLENLELISGYPFESDGCLYQRKWYDVKKDIEMVASDDPSIIITVEAAGEESGDIYRIYAWRGIVEVVRPTITYEDPDWMEDAVQSLEDEHLKQIRVREKEEKELLKSLLDKYGLPGLDK